MFVGLTYNLKGHPATLKEPSDVYDDRFAEWDNIETITAIADALSEKHQVIYLPADKDIYQKLKSNTPDIVFNIAEGAHYSSREAQIPALLEYLNIPYTGSDPFTLSACLDKSRAKEILTYHGIPNPRFEVVRKKDLDSLQWTSFPAIVKPLWEGSSKGIFNRSVVEDPYSLRILLNDVFERYDQPALIEEFITGREFTVAVVGNGNEVEILPLVEISFDRLPPEAKPIYSYEAKWIWDVPEKPLDIFQCPAKLDSELEIGINRVVREAYHIMGCRDWCRIDVRLDNKGVPNIIELNPLPGILPDPKANSCFPKAAREAGLSYTDLLLKVLDIAINRVGLTKDEMMFKERKVG